MSSVVVYMRPGCHLCEEAESQLRPIAAAAGREVELVNIESDDELHRRYLEAIPVIEVDGVEIARLDEFRDGRLQTALAGD
jgi:hypothetical protein